MGFYFGHNRLEIVNEYTYLGILFKNNGSLKHAGEHLANRARKAFYSLNKLNQNCHTGITFHQKHGLKGNFAIFYMLAKYVPGDIKYIITKFYRHISTNNEANRKFVILISNFSTSL